MSRRLCWYKLQIENEINFLVVYDNLESPKSDYCSLASVSFLVDGRQAGSWG